MKKLVFVLIALFCFFLIACNEKQNNEKLESKSVDNKINLESKRDLEKTNQEQEAISDEKSQGVEQNENYLAVSEGFTEKNDSTDYDFALEIGKVDYPMVSFSIKKYSYSLNSVSGVTFKVDLENVTLECSVDYGSFSYYDNEKKCVFSSFDKIQWCPSFIYDSSLIEEFYFNNVEKAYMDIIIISGNDIIGYVVISLEQLSRTSYFGDVVKSVLFEYDSDNIDVTKEFVLNEIEILKKNLR